MKDGNRSTFLSRNVRFLWLFALFIPPAIAFLLYNATPHEEIWHEVLYSLLCLPLFAAWLIALIACVLSFALHRTLSNA